jgi:WhiB family redox-sensing transcriptional regulator
MKFSFFSKLLKYQGGGMSTKPIPYDENLISQWMEMGVCRSSGTEIFFSSSTKDQNIAKAMCSHCPVINICLRFALENYEIGVWGGTSDRQRKNIRKYRPN